MAEEVITRTDIRCDGCGRLIAKVVHLDNREERKNRITTKKTYFYRIAKTGLKIYKEKEYREIGISEINNYGEKINSSDDIILCEPDCLKIYLFNKRLKESSRE